MVFLVSAGAEGSAADPPCLGRLFSLAVPLEDPVLFFMFVGMFLFSGGLVGLVLELV